MSEYKYVVQRRFQTGLAKRVGEALDRIFEYVDGKSLHVLEDVTMFVTQKPIPKKKRNEICSSLLKQARMDGDEETLSFVVVPYSESLAGKAEANKWR